MAGFVDVGFRFFFGDGGVGGDFVRGNVFGFEAAGGAGTKEEAGFDGGGSEAFIVGTGALFVVGEVVEALEDFLATAGRGVSEWLRVEGKGRAYNT